MINPAVAAGIILLVGAVGDRNVQLLVGIALIILGLLRIV